MSTYVYPVIVNHFTQPMGIRTTPDLFHVVLIGLAGKTRNRDPWWSMMIHDDPTPQRLRGSSAHVNKHLGKGGWSSGSTVRWMCTTKTYLGPVKSPSEHGRNEKKPLTLVLLHNTSYPSGPSAQTTAAWISENQCGLWCTNATPDERLRMNIYQSSKPNNIFTHVLLTIWMLDQLDPNINTHLLSGNLLVYVRVHVYLWHEKSDGQVNQVAKTHMGLFGAPKKTWDADHFTVYNIN